MPIKDENFKIDALRDEVTGILTKQEGQDNKKIVIIAHGFGGAPKEFLHKQASLLMPRCGYDVARINLYSKKCPMDKTNTSILIDKIKATVDYYRSKYEKIFLIGHSYGGVNILEANLDGVEAASLWEGSFDLKKLLEKRETEECCGFIFYTSRVIKNKIGKEFFDEVISYDENKCDELAENVKHPIQVIYGTASELYQNKRNFTEKCNVKNRYDEIEGAKHNFDEGNTVFELIDKTLDWFGEF